MLEKLDLFWLWLTGKKAVLGFMLGTFCATPHLETWIPVNVIDIIFYYSTALGFLGLGHKVIRAARPPVPRK